MGWVEGLIHKSFAMEFEVQSPTAVFYRIGVLPFHSFFQLNSPSSKLCSPIFFGGGDKPGKNTFLLLGGKLPGEGWGDNCAWLFTINRIPHYLD